MKMPKFQKAVLASNSPFNTFSAFVQASSLALAKLDLAKSDEYEKRFVQLLTPFKKEYKVPNKQFGEWLAELCIEYENDREQDVLGTVFHELELHNAWKGQFFTPYSVARLMATMVVGDIELNADDLLFVNEPACGSGAMLIALAQVFHAKKVNLSQVVFVGQDVDQRCAAMAHIQLSLLGLNGMITVGDTLRMTQSDCFYTPCYFTNAMPFRIQRWEYKKAKDEAFAQRQSKLHSLVRQAILGAK